MSRDDDQPEVNVDEKALAEVILALRTGKPIPDADPLNVAAAAVHDLLSSRAKREAAQEAMNAAKIALDAADEEVQTAEERVREILDLPFNEDR